MMKQRLLNLLIVALVTAIASMTPMYSNPVAQCGSDVPSFLLGSAVRLAEKVPSRAEAVTIPIEFNLGSQSGDILLEGAVAFANGSYTDSYEFGFDFSSDELKFVFNDLPVGNYTFLIVADYTSDKGRNQLILLIRDIDVTAETVVKVERTSDCRDYAIEHIAPDNTILTLPAEYEGEPTTASAAMFFSMLRDVKAGPVFLARNSASYGERNNIVTNVDPDEFSINCADVMAGESGMYAMMFPLDMSKPKTSTNTGKWESATVNFHQTPFNKKFTEILGEQYPQYSYMFCLASVDDEMVTYGFDGYRYGFDKTRQHVYNGYSGNIPLEVMLSPVDYPVQSAKKAIKGQPLRFSGDGICQIGLQFDLSEFLYNNLPVEWGNPSYSIPVDGITYGNCAPTLLHVSWMTGLEYNYFGRYGENIGIDTFRFPNNWTDEQREALGKQTNEVNVTINNQPFATTLDEFYSKKFTPGKVSMRIATDNVLVDDEIPGFNVTELDYTLEENISPDLPNLTGMQFRNISGDITDRFDYSDQGVLQFTAGSFTLVQTQSNDDVMYYSPLVGLQVEYAPYGSDDFIPLDLDLADELSYERGYGQGYCASLASVDRPSANKWYDLRFIFHGPNQSKMTQTISPAFRIDSPTSIAAVVGENETIKVVGNDIIAPAGAQVYNIAGVPCCPTGLLPGIYIVKYGNESLKVLVP